MKLYYTAPEDEIFEEVKEKAIKLWTEKYPVEVSFDYAEKKVEKIIDLENISDNMMFIVAMFDMYNQKILADSLSLKARMAIRKRLENGGSLYNVF